MFVDLLIWWGVRHGVHIKTKRSGSFGGCGGDEVYRVAEASSEADTYQGLRWRPSVDCFVGGSPFVRGRSKFMSEVSRMLVVIGGGLLSEDTKASGKLIVEGGRLPTLVTSSAHIGGMLQPRQRQRTPYIGCDRMLRVRLQRQCRWNPLLVSEEGHSLLVGKSLEDHPRTIVATGNQNYPLQKLQTL
eukprot:Gb_02294 [translate_table: standard]